MYNCVSPISQGGGAGGPPSSLWKRNTELCTWTVPMNLLLAAIQSSREQPLTDPLRGFDASTWAVIVINGMIYISVSINMSIDIDMDMDICRYRYTYTYIHIGRIIPLILLLMILILYLISKEILVYRLSRTHLGRRCRKTHTEERVVLLLSVIIIPATIA